ncbi:DNA-directed RNA polymerase subunit delta [Kroppenstedtia eburnea]|uniref:Probable DNA-directed RNA polymerase subunit delta n=1 Tax=Kroppenstedtia eburnea TaxID=714067 RepID=A0A1N7JK82_9BACL|nr:DNA-directed RNA polymerase subunit delta [Kroppenstedtia eburnea]EGK10397.1 DNA-directed RNA polymerase sigma subunit RpoE [Desmospora sp. 8437]QKI83543.1 DNA-directed RNA polymerase subunit delta [Kroppenstedtia eburnea]SIS49773.1 DNA-directed RNA polymerase subunit delta [Kroppenstedtia eburnea]
MNLAELNEEDIRETAMVDIAYHILHEKGEPLLYREIMGEIAGLKGFSEEETQRLIAQLYTEINIDGRFICVGKSLWGLKQWYPTEQATDSAVAQNVKEDVDELEEDLFDEEEPDLEEMDPDGDEDFDGDFDDGEFDDETPEEEEEGS